MATTGKHGQIDIESLGVDKGTVVLSIATTTFTSEQALNFHTKSLPAWVEELRAASVVTVMPILDQLAHGLVIDKNTAAWWNGRKDKCEMQMFGTVEDKLRIFDGFIAAGEYEYLWAKSPSFDMRLIAGLYEAYGRKSPIAYRQEADVRTVIDHTGLSFNPKELGLRMHDPVDDAVFQTLYTMAFLHRESLIKRVDVLAEKQMVELPKFISNLEEGAKEPKKAAVRKTSSKPVLKAAAQSSQKKGGKK